jgi:hypothetical protein
VIGYRFHRCSAWTIADNPRRAGRVQRLSLRPMEKRSPRLKQCGTEVTRPGVQGGEHFAAQEEVIGRGFKLSGGVA